MDITNEEQDVIEEFLAEAIKLEKNKEEGKRCFISKPSEFSSRLKYKLQHGNDAPRKLLVDYIRYLSSLDPNDPKIQLLESVIPQSGVHTWLLQSEYEKIYGKLPLDKIVFDGFGYVRLKGGIRVDNDDDLYRDERLAFNQSKGKFS